MKLHFLGGLSKYVWILNLMKIRSLVAKLFHADGRTHKQTVFVNLRTVSHTPLPPETRLMKRSSAPCVQEVVLEAGFSSPWRQTDQKLYYAMHFMFLEGFLQFVIQRFKILASVCIKWRFPFFNKALNSPQSNSASIGLATPWIWRPLSPSRLK